MTYIHPPAPKSVTNASGPPEKGTGKGRQRLDLLAALRDTGDVVLGILDHPASTGGEVTPFLKWAGGKRWLMPMGTRLGRQGVRRYFEPFLGSGAMFFSIRPAYAFLSDANEELVETYEALKEDWEAVRSCLLRHNSRHDEHYYYKVRSAKPRTRVTRAARFIYLNRTCWNGLYRVNRNGEFNTPIGSKTSAILSTDDFEAISSALVNASITCSDFEVQIDQAGEGDLIFADPPYTVRHQYNGFVKYNEKLFSWDDQVRLCDVLLRAKGRGALVICTNADHKSIRELYGPKFHIESLSRFSSIAGKGGVRGSYAEVAIIG